MRTARITSMDPAPETITSVLVTRSGHIGPYLCGLCAAIDVSLVTRLARLFSRRARYYHLTGLGLRHSDGHGQFHVRQEAHSAQTSHFGSGGSGGTGFS